VSDGCPGRLAKWHDVCVRARPICMFIVIALVSAACGGGDEGDADAYCRLIRTGSADDLAALIEVAPVEIRDTVLQLDNATRGLVDIEELDQLFDAAFDLDAQAARSRFDEYSSDMCGT